jgi:hypothetical protein
MTMPKLTQSCLQALTAGGQKIMLNPLQIVAVCEPALGDEDAARRPLDPARETLILTATGVAYTVQGDYATILGALDLLLDPANA